MLGRILQRMLFKRSWVWSPWMICLKHPQKYPITYPCLDSKCYTLQLIFPCNVDMELNRVTITSIKNARTEYPMQLKSYSRFCNYKSEIIWLLHVRQVNDKLTQPTGNHWLAASCRLTQRSWWRHQMETFSALLAICAGKSPVPGEFPTQRPVTRSFNVFFDLRVTNGWVNIITRLCGFWREITSV